MNKKLNKEKYNPFESPTLKSWGEAERTQQKNVTVECGWGRLIFANTFDCNKKIIESLRSENKGKRDIAFYLRDPQVLIANAPDELFLDPSFTYRLWFENYNTGKSKGKSPNFVIRELVAEKDLDMVNALYLSHNMVEVDKKIFQSDRISDAVKFWVAEDNLTNEVIGVVMGANHKIAFDDSEMGSSLWALAVDKDSNHLGLGTQLVKHVISYYVESGCKFLDVSVLHNNKRAISLYKKMGFEQVPVFCIKNKNQINENLYTVRQPYEKLNIYSKIIVDEAKKRGIKVDVLDYSNNYFKLIHGGSSVVCRESLTELTSSIAMSICSDKQITSKIFSDAGFNTPDQIVHEVIEKSIDFLHEHKSVVVKPAVGEQGDGITIGVMTVQELKDAVENAKSFCKKVLVEKSVEGVDLRLVVINHKLVAAAIRKPPVVVGDGTNTILKLIEKQSRRRQAATEGESKIPIDDELKRNLSHKGYNLDQVLPAGEKVTVRKTPNLHTGGTIHDVTNELHPELINVGEEASKALDIPVVGLDFIVSDIKDPDYFIIEANERPGLANHEPQPTAEKFIDLLFPQTSTLI